MGCLFGNVPQFLYGQAVAEPSDFELLEQWRAGDRAAGNTLFSRHFRPLFRFFRTKVADEVAEDLTQVSFLACVDGRDKFRNASSFRTYLFAIARNQLFMHFRKLGRREAMTAFETQSMVDLGAGPSTLVAARAEQRLLLEALRRIPVDFQIAIELYYWEGLPTAEVATVLEIPEGTVRSRLTRAREHLAKQMRAIAESPKLAESTVADFERWAQSLRDAFD
ncbi:MAG: RNA polymerase sigma factor [Nannocystaceae bacterium]|nr:RNA polymerase sigma factor [bacterium]